MNRDGIIRLSNEDTDDMLDMCHINHLNNDIDNNNCDDMKINRNGRKRTRKEMVNAESSAEDDDDYMNKKQRLELNQDIKESSSDWDDYDTDSNAEDIDQDPNAQNKNHKRKQKRKTTKRKNKK